MKKPFVLIAAIVAVVGLGAVTAVAKERIHVGTYVTLHVTDENPGDPAQSFSGRVKAKKGCEKRRTVVVMGPYGPVGSDRSNVRGEFKIVEQQLGRSRRGSFRFRVVVEQRKITKNSGHKIVCMEGRAMLSEPIPY
jgi:hypothetical protein